MERKDLLADILGYMKLAEKIDKYAEENDGSISKEYEEIIPIGDGMITVCVRYDNVPSGKLNDSYNLLNKCFENFYRKFFETILSDKIANQ